MEREKEEERKDKERRREYDQAGFLKALESLEGKQLRRNTGCQGAGIRNQTAAFPKVLEPPLTGQFLLATHFLIQRWSNPIFRQDLR